MKISSKLLKFLTNREQSKKECHSDTRISDIVKIQEFVNLLDMEESVVNSMTDSMKKDGFKPGHEIHLWDRDGQLILIDGHTRLHCWQSLGNTKIPSIIHHFETLEDAKKFAIHEQSDRRNLSGEALLKAVAEFNFEKGRGNSGEEKGKASAIIGKQLGVSSKTVEKARVVLKEATVEQKEAIRKGKSSVNQIYNQIRSKAPAAKAEDNLSKLSTKEKGFIDGIRYAIVQINSGISLKALYHQTNENFDYSKMSVILKDADFSKLLDVSVIMPEQEEV